MYHGDHPGHKMSSFVRLRHGRIKPAFLYEHIVFLELAEIVDLAVENDEEHVADLERVVLVARISGHFEAILVIGTVIADDRHIPDRAESERERERSEDLLSKNPQTGSYS